MHALTRSTKAVIVTIAVVLFLAASAGTLAVADDYIGRDTVPLGTTIAGVDVSGMPRAEAMSLVQEAIAEPLSAPLAVAYDGDEYVLDRADMLHVNVDDMVDQALEPKRTTPLAARVVDRVTGRPAGTEVELAAAIDRSALRAWVDAHSSAIETPPADATMLVTDGGLVLVPSATGVTVDTTTTVNALSEALVSGATASRFVTVVTQPQVTETDLGPEILIDLSQRRLYLYVNGELERTYGVAVGAPGHSTPRGDFEITLKRYLPTWYNPGSDWAKDMPAYIGPGPGNPLGTRALNLNAPGIRIHGTSNDASIGTAASHGCLRMHRWDIEDLYERVEVGTKVHIVR